MQTPASVILPVPDVVLVSFTLSFITKAILFSYYELILISEFVPAAPGPLELVLGNVIVNVPFEQDLVPPKSRTTTNLSLDELLYITP